LGTKQTIILLALAFGCGLLGGALSAKLLLLELASTHGELRFKEVIVANEFHLVDDQGKDRWVLRLSKEGEPNITFINKRGWAPMAIGVNKDGFPFFNMIPDPHKKGGPTISLMDSQMKNRALLRLSEKGDPHLSLLDRDGQRRAVLGGIVVKNPVTGLSERRPVSSLVLFGDDGRIIWAAPPLHPFPVRISEKRINQAQ
jgi:hypothetical protein